MADEKTMTIEESVEVVPSEDNGNAPAEVVDPTPSDPAKTEDDPAAVDPAKSAVAEPELFELPDGRKVDAATLSKEWKDNFYPDYTKKSQALAARDDINNVEKSPIDDPDWQPQSYSELLSKAADIAEQRQLQKEQESEKARLALETEVGSQLEAVKKTDPNVNENALFLHATKYGFRDLRFAHQNMKDMSETAKKVQKQTAADVTKRGDPVSINPGASGTKLNPSAFASGVDYLRALKGQ